MSSESISKKINYYQVILDLLFLIFLLYINYYAIFYFSKAKFFLSNECIHPVILTHFYYFNLIFHELSHLVFSPFGEFMMILGGTLGEFIFPLIFLIYFLKNWSYRGLSFCLWWIGFNLITASVYMKDALIRVLPLIVENGSHDWVYIFTRMGVLKYATAIGNITLIVGIIFALSALIQFGYCAVKNIYDF